MRKARKPASECYAFRHGRPLRHVARGFTLTEVGIVIGVIGVITACIFAAASTAQYRARLNQGVDEINLIVGNMRSLYAGQNASAAAAIALNSATNEGTFVSQGVFPKEMLRQTNTSLADNPWNQTVVAGSAQVGVVTGGQFIVSYQNIPYDVCADLLVRNSTPGTDTGLVQITVGASTFTGTALPISPVQAAQVCVSGSTYTINWYYTLGS